MGHLWPLKTRFFSLRWPPLLVALLLALVVGLLTTACSGSPSNIREDNRKATGTVNLENAGDLPPSPQVGRLAPDFTLTDLSGNSVTLSDFRGKIVFLNFWASWCPPCRAEMPEIEAFYQEYRNGGLKVIGVDLYEKEDTVRQFVERGGYSWIFVIDTTGEVTKNYGIAAIPTSFFLDKEGIIRAINIGAMTKKEMESMLAEAMK